MPLSRRVRNLLYISAAMFIALGALVAIAVIRFQPVARGYLISELKQRYGSEVELGNFQISMLPQVHITAENVVFRFHGRRDLPPIFTMRRIDVRANFASFFRHPRRIALLRLQGLEIHIPPKDKREANISAEVNNAADSKVPFVLQQVIADGTTFEILPADPAKEPLKFEVVQLTLHSVGIGRAMRFHAELNNPRPPGSIHSDGEFGPWVRDDPRSTRLDGLYTFSNADLGVFKGITGTLGSSGRYQGELDRIEVQGTADVPDFALRLAHHPERLHTTFNATVDGTNGDTELHPVHAVLGNSAFDVSGAIERGALERHKVIHLTAKAANANIQDFLRLSIKTGPAPMKGRLGFDTAVTIPPGEADVSDRLELNGRFTMSRVAFTSPDVQEKIASLSHRAQGEPENHDPSGVTADFDGRFLLANGTLTLPRLGFDVPGAHVDLDGTYTLRSGDLDFKGEAKLQATVSQMTTGVKHIFLKPLDPLFRRDGAGTVLPIEITGTRGSPSFRLDIGKVFKRR